MHSILCFIYFYILYNITQYIYITEYLKNTRELIINNIIILLYILLYLKLINV